MFRLFVSDRTSYRRFASRESAQRTVSPIESKSEMAQLHSNMRRPMIHLNSTAQSLSDRTARIGNRSGARKAALPGLGLGMRSMLNIGRLESPSSAERDCPHQRIIAHGVLRRLRLWP